MQSFWTLHHRKFAVALLSLLPVLLIASGRTTDTLEVTAPGAVIQSGFAQGQRGAQVATSGVGNFLTSWTRSSDAERVEELQREVARLQEERARLIGVLQENERLRGLVGFQKQQAEFELVPARVIARDLTPYFRVLKIRIDARGAISERQPVVVAQGVVGYVHQVYGRQADVIVLADPRARIDAIAQRTRSPGIVEGLGHQRNYRARVSYLRQDDAVREGDLMVTSGLDGVFPGELILGTITSIQSSERGLFQEVEIEPAVDLSRVREVFVITGTQ